MRLVSLLASAALALLLAFSASPAQAHGSDARIWVSLGDVTFSAGIPYHRYDHRPLQIVHGSHGPRYFYYAPPPAHYYAPPPPPHYGYGHGYRHAPRRHHYQAPRPQPRRGYDRHRHGY